MGWGRTERIPSLTLTHGSSRSPLFWTALFALFLYPVSIGGFSVNYSFALCVLALILLRGKVKKLHPELVLAIVFYTGVFVVASVAQGMWADLFLRRCASFLIFMTTFAFVLIVLDSKMTSAFKTGLILVSTFLSLRQIVVFLYLSQSGPLHFEAKDLVGSQRLGFLYIVAIWVLLLWGPPNWKATIARYLLTAVLGLGAMLTFSRSTLVALAGSVLLFSLWSLWSAAIRGRTSALSRLGALVVPLVGVAVMIYQFAPLTLEFYTERLVEAFVSGMMQQKFMDPGSSEGARRYIWEASLDFVSGHPLTGTGYLGVWALLGEDIAGSTHNQYVDVLLRTGIIGLGIYLCILWRIARHLYRSDQGLFWGLVGFLLYGLFHETAKESQGAVVLAFLLGTAFSGTVPRMKRLLV